MSPAPRRRAAPAPKAAPVAKAAPAYRWELRAGQRDGNVVLGAGEEPSWEDALRAAERAAGWDRGKHANPPPWTDREAYGLIWPPGKAWPRCTGPVA
jgi:hypothetical protein